MLTGDHDFINNFKFCKNYVLDVSSKPKISRKRFSSDALPTLDPNSCNGSKKSKLESKAISALVAYGSDSSDDETENQEDQKSTILQRLQQKAEMFKQRELDKLTVSCKSNGQPDILDIIGKEVPPDYTIEQSSVVKSPENKVTSDIFEILKSEVPPDYMSDTSNNFVDKDPKLNSLVDSNLATKLQSNIVENDFKQHSNTDEKIQHSTLDSVKENSSKSFNLIANYGEEDLDDSGNWQ